MKRAYALSHSLRMIFNKRSIKAGVRPIWRDGIEATSSPRHIQTKTPYLACK
nr:hypothetical protein [Paraprevotella clara]